MMAIRGKHPIRRTILFAGAQALRVTVPLLPLAWARACGVLLGLAVYTILRGHRRVALAQLEQALGATHSPAEQRRIARRIFQHLGMNLMELLAWPRWTRIRLERAIRVTGVEHLQTALAQGRGALMLSGHLGNWELLAAYFGMQGHRGGVIARRLRYPEYETLLKQLRLTKGVETFDREGSFKEIVRRLRDNQMIGILPDQDVDSVEGVFVEFFGRPAWTPIGPVALSTASGAPLLPTYIVREGQGFHIYIEPAITVTAAGNRQQDLLMATQAWSRVAESFIRRYPDQWVWMHPRWKTQPSSAASAAPAPAQPLCALHAAAAVVLFAVALGAPIGCSRSEPSGDAAIQPAEAPPKPNQVVEQLATAFTLSGYEQSGQKKWEVAGETANIMDEIIRMTNVTGVAYGEEGPVTITAKQGALNRSNQDVHLEEQVVAMTEDGAVLTTDALDWHADTETVSGEQPLTIVRDNMQVRGVGGLATPNLKQASVKEQVEVTVKPEPARNALPLIGASDKPTIITCDGPLEVDYEHSIATFHQNVHIVDERGEVYADVMDVVFDPKTKAILQVVARERVRIVRGEDIAYCDRADYDPRLNKVLLTGQPKLVVREGELPTP